MVFAYISAICSRFTASISDSEATLSEDDEVRHGDEERRNQALNLHTIPVDILLHIASFLDPENKASLTLCNRPLFSSLGKGSFGPLRIIRGVSGNPVRTRFLKLLLISLPDYIYCGTCSKLHPASRRGPLASLIHEQVYCYEPFDQENLKLRTIIGSFGTPKYSFNHNQLRLVMERHRLGPGHGISPDLLEVQEIYSWPSSWCDNIMSMLSVEARIIQDELNLRVQHLLSFSDRGALGRAYNSALQYSRICNHHGDVYRLLRCKVEHDNQDKSCPTCAQFNMCKECKIEFQADMRVLETGGIILVITRMLNLGGGRDEEDPKWTRISTYKNNLFHEIGFGTSETWAQYEGQERFSPLDQLIEKNLSILISRGYERDFTRNKSPWNAGYQPDSHWLWQHNVRIDRNWKRWEMYWGTASDQHP